MDMKPAIRHLRTVESYNISVLNSRNCKFSGDDFFCLSKKQQQNLMF